MAVRATSENQTKKGNQHNTLEESAASTENNTNAITVIINDLLHVI